MIDACHVESPMGSQSTAAGAQRPKSATAIAVWLLGLTIFFAIAPMTVHARWYDPERGRFMSRSPVHPAIEHPYAFIENDPVNFTDNTGLLSLGKWGSRIGRGLGGIGLGIGIGLGLGNLYACPLIWGDALGEQFEGPLNAGTMTDKYAHCVVICTIAKECGKRATHWAMWAQEWEHWFDTGHQDTNDDLAADHTGMNIAEQQKNGSCAFGKDCEEGCEKAGY